MNFGPHILIFFENSRNVLNKH